MPTLNKDVNLPEEIDLWSEEFITDISHFPAVENVGCNVYLIENNEIACVARIGSLYDGIVRVYLNNDAALERFKDDYAVKVLGAHASFPFNQRTGWYEMGMAADDDISRRGLTIVDKFHFDLGIASKMRYSHIVGYGKLSTIKAPKE